MKLTVTLTEISESDNQIKNARVNCGFQTILERPRCRNCTHLEISWNDYYCKKHPSVLTEIAGDNCMKNLHGICKDWQEKHIRSLELDDIRRK